MNQSKKNLVGSKDLSNVALYVDYNYKTGIKSKNKSVCLKDEIIQFN